MLTVRQETYLVRVIIAVVVVVLLVSLVLIAKNKSSPVSDVVLQEGCIENGFPLPSVQEFWEYVKAASDLDESVEQQVSVMFLELDMEGRVALHFELFDGTKAHFTIMQVCTNEEGLYYPILEFGVVK